MGFRFDGGGFSLGLATDMGRFSDSVVQTLKDCQVLLIEANYDEEMLRWSRYPAFLKRRITGPGGHLSNTQTQLLLKQLAGPRLEEVVLIHLSENNNRPELARAAAEQALQSHKSVRLHVAPRHKPGLPLSFRPREIKSPKPQQIELPF